MAQPKFNFVNIQKSRVFTDRQEAQELFWEKYDYLTNHKSEYYVISYYGIGGIGKTSLVTHLCHNLRGKKAYYVKYDFMTNGVNDKKNILVDLAGILRSKYKQEFDFPLFYSALILLAKKSGENFKIDKDISTILSEHEWMEILLDDIGLIPIVGTVAQIIKAIDATTTAIRNAFRNQSNIDQYNTIITAMNAMESNEILDNLHTYFCLDMVENMGNLGKPLVIILDTYEHYIDTFKKGGAASIDDAWLRQGSNSVIQAIPGILWVISGRDCLQWNKYNEWSDDGFAELLLESLPLEETKNYLQAFGITDDSLVNGLFELTLGTPIFLDVCIEQYQTLKAANQTPNLAQFGNRLELLLERYLRYLDSASLDMLQIVSCFMRWTDEQICEIAPQIKTINSFSVSRYRHFLSHSMIKKSDRGTYYLHETVQKAVISTVDEATKSEIYLLIIDYMIGRLKKNTNNLERERLLKELLHYVFLAGDSRIIIVEFWLIRKVVEQIAISGNHELLYEICYTIYKCITDEHEEQKADYAIAQYFIAYALERTGEAQAAINYLASCMWMLAEECSILSLQLKLEIELLYAKCLMKIGEYSNAKKSCIHICDFSKERMGEDNQFNNQALRILGAALLFSDDKDMALHISKQLYISDSEKYGEQNAITNQSRVLYARSLNANALYDEAIKHYLIAISINERIYGRLHLETSSSYNNLGYTYYNAGEYRKALEMYNAAINIRQKLLPENHPNLARTYNNIGMACCELGLFDEAMENCMLAFEKRKAGYVENHPEIANSYYSIGIILLKMQEYQNAIDMLEQALAIRQEKLQKNHSELKKTYVKLREAYITVGDIEKAEKLEKEMQK